MVIKLMIVDDHQLMRDVLVHLLWREPDFDVVSVAADASEALALVQEAGPDVVVMDIDLPGIDGIAATRALLDLQLPVKVVMLSASCSETLVRTSADAGACGYLLKGDAPEYLCEGIRAAARGDHPMAPRVRALCLAIAEADGHGRGQDALAAAAWCADEI